MLCVVAGVMMVNLPDILCVVAGAKVCFVLLQVSWWWTYLMCCVVAGAKGCGVLLQVTQ